MANKGLGLEFSTKDVIILVVTIAQKQKKHLWPVIVCCRKGQNIFRHHDILTQFLKVIEVPLAKKKRTYINR